MIISIGPTSPRGQIMAFTTVKGKSDSSMRTFTRELNRYQQMFMTPVKLAKQTKEFFFHLLLNTKLNDCAIKISGKWWINSVWSAVTLLSTPFGVIFLCYLSCYWELYHFELSKCSNTMYMCIINTSKSTVEYDVFCLRTAYLLPRSGELEAYKAVLIFSKLFSCWLNQCEPSEEHTQGDDT